MITVTAAIIVQNGKVLICRRKTGLKNGGLWEFPGGKREKGESLRECLERELFEELGVRAKAGEIFGEGLYEYDYGTIKLIGFQTELESREFTLTDHDMIEWADIKKLSDFRLSEADIPFARKLKNINI